MPVSHAARLVAISSDAKTQSEQAIRNSLRLLRRSTYPHDRLAPEAGVGEPLAVELQDT